MVVGVPAAADPVTTHELNEAFPLGGGQVSTIRGEPLRLHFVSVLEDSRCPPTLLCYWPGQARIAVDAQVGDAPPASIVLDTRPGPDPGGQPVSVGPFTMQLQDLDPSPRTEHVAPRSSCGAPASSRAAALPERIVTHPAGRVVNSA